MSRDDEQWIKQLVQEQTGVLQATGKETLRAVIAKDLAVAIIAKSTGDPEQCVKDAVQLTKLILGD